MTVSFTKAATAWTCTPRSVLVAIWFSTQWPTVTTQFIPHQEDHGEAGIRLPSSSFFKSTLTALSRSTNPPFSSQSRISDFWLGLEVIKRTKTRSADELHLEPTNNAQTSSFTSRQYFHYWIHESSILSTTSIRIGIGIGSKVVFL